MKKRTVIKSDVLGFCMGVEKAMKLAVMAKEKFPNKDIYTFGQLIHNAEALAYLKNHGVNVLQPKDFFENKNIRYNNAVVIIRAHGIEPLVEKALKDSGAEIINATCPHVISGQKKAEKNAKSRNIILAGDKNHQELKGISGYAALANKGECVIVQNEEEAMTVHLPENGLDFCIIAQTTIKHSEYYKIVEALKKRIPNIQVFNSVCLATQKRQDALKDLIKVTDAILVVGGKNSANTKRLLKTALDLSKPAWLIENESEIPKELYNYSRIGITAGASTPEFVIEKIVQKLESM